MNRYVVRWRDTRLPKDKQEVAITYEDRGQASILLEYLENQAETTLLDYRELS